MSRMVVLQNEDSEFIAQWAEGADEDFNELCFWESADVILACLKQEDIPSATVPSRQPQEQQQPVQQIWTKGGLKLVLLKAHIWNVYQVEVNGSKAKQHKLINCQ